MHPIVDTTSYRAKTFYRDEVAQRCNEWFQQKRLRRFMWRRETAIIKRLLESLPDGATIMDLPSGTGRFLPLLLDRGLDVVSADISRDMLRQSMSHAAIKEMLPGYVVCDAEMLPFKDESVDYLLTVKFLELLPYDVAIGVLREFHRICARGMILHFRVVQPTTPFVTLARNMRRILKSRASSRRTQNRQNKARMFRLTRKELEQVLSSLGLRIVSSQSVAWFWGHSKICVVEKIRPSA
jgi:ubiquinone/menaquinone biosynthesis C-methylase UbiE